MELKGEGFSLRGWRLNDAASLQKHADNPMICRYLFDRFPSPYTLADADAWVQRWHDQPAPMVNLAIAVNNEVVGGIGLEMRADVYRKTPLLGYWLAQHLWGQGIMPKAVQLMTTYAFEQMDLIAIQANVFGGNPASMRVLEKAGFSRQGIIRQSAVKHGVIMDEHVFLINRQPII